MQWLPEQVTRMALLTRTERKEARKLWEEVFPEDTGQFLDYYEQYVADHNRIFGEKENGELVSMVQLNPYKIQMGEERADSYYIVAVATREACRHQGRMRRLLIEAMRTMYQEEIPFTFLMPASEAIYRPFDFVTVYRQTIFTMGAEMGTEARWHCRPCDRRQLKELAVWSEHYLRKHCRVFTVRSKEYYERIWKEQESMNGQILLFYEKEELKGYCFSGYEGSAEAWELAVEAKAAKQCDDSMTDDRQEEMANRRAIEALTRWFGERHQLPVRICGLLPGSGIEGVPHKEIASRPMTMVRIVNLKALVRRLRARKSVEFVLTVQDPLLEENCGTFRFEIGPERSRLIRISEQKNVPEVTVAELAAALFGAEKNEKIPQEDICLLNGVYLNEIV